jgi:hypothetical protein
MKDTTTHIALLYAGTLVLCVAVLVLILIGIEVNQEASEVRARVHELEDRVHRLKRQSKKEQEGGELLIIPGSVMEQNQFRQRQSAMLPGLPDERPFVDWRAVRAMLLPE